MGDKQILQRGNRVKIDSKGNRSSRPMEDGEADAQMTANARRFGADAVDAAYAGTTKKMQDLPNRRDMDIEQATGTPKKADDESKMVDKKSGIRFAAGGMVRRGYGKARGA